MSNHEVMIDGVRYIPAREAYPDIREAVSRVVAEEWWGELGDDWQAQFDRYMDGCQVIVTDDGEWTKHSISAEQFVDKVMTMLATKEAK